MSSSEQLQLQSAPLPTQTVAGKRIGKRREKKNAPEIDKEVEHLISIIDSLGNWDTRGERGIESEIQSLNGFLSQSFDKIEKGALAARNEFIDNRNDANREQTIALKFRDMSVKVQKEITDHIVRVFDDRFQQDKESMLKFRHRLRKDVETIRESNNAFRTYYDIESRNREAEGYRVFKMQTENFYRGQLESLITEIQELKNHIKLSEASSEVVLKRYQALLKENESLNHDLTQASVKLQELHRSKLKSGGKSRKASVVLTPPGSGRLPDVRPGSSSGLHHGDLSSRAAETLPVGHSGSNSHNTGSDILSNQVISSTIRRTIPVMIDQWTQCDYPEKFSTKESTSEKLPQNSIETKSEKSERVPESPPRPMAKKVIISSSDTLPDIFSEKALVSESIKSQVNPLSPNTTKLGSDSGMSSGSAKSPIVEMVDKVQSAVEPNSEQNKTQGNSDDSSKQIVVVQSEKITNEPAIDKIQLVSMSSQTDVISAKAFADNSTDCNDMITSVPSNNSSFTSETPIPIVGCACCDSLRSELFQCREALQVALASNEAMREQHSLELSKATTVTITATATAMSTPIEPVASIVVTSIASNSNEAESTAINVIEEHKCDNSSSNNNNSNIINNVEIVESGEIPSNPTIQTPNEHTTTNTKVEEIALKEVKASEVISVSESIAIIDDKQNVLDTQDNGNTNDPHQKPPVTRAVETVLEVEVMLPSPDNSNDDNKAYIVANIDLCSDVEDPGDLTDFVPMTDECLPSGREMDLLEGSHSLNGDVNLYECNLSRGSRGLEESINGSKVDDGNENDLGVDSYAFEDDIEDMKDLQYNNNADAKQESLNLGYVSTEAVSMDLDILPKTIPENSLDLGSAVLSQMTSLNPILLNDPKEEAIGHILDATDKIVKESIVLHGNFLSKDVQKLQRLIVRCCDMYNDLHTQFLTSEYHNSRLSARLRDHEANAENQERLYKLQIRERSLLLNLMCDEVNSLRDMLSVVALTNEMDAKKTIPGKKETTQMKKDVSLPMIKIDDNFVDNRPQSSQYRGNVGNSYSRTIQSHKLNPILSSSMPTLTPLENLLESPTKKLSDPSNMHRIMALSRSGDIVQRSSRALAETDGLKTTLHLQEKDKNIDKFEELKLLRNEIASILQQNELKKRKKLMAVQKAREEALKKREIQKKEEAEAKKLRQRIKK